MTPLFPLTYWCDGLFVLQLAESTPEILLQLCCANFSDLTQSSPWLYLHGVVCIRTETASSLLETDVGVLGSSCADCQCKHQDNMTTKTELHELALELLIFCIFFTMVIQPTEDFKKLHCLYQLFPTCFKISYLLYSLLSNLLWFKFLIWLKNRCQICCNILLYIIITLFHMTKIFFAVFCLLSLAAQSVLTTLTADWCPKWIKRQVSSFYISCRPLLF